MPKISVIVPVYKVEPYLRQCVDSILSQTYTDFELILVDDGSPDLCGTICDTYAKQDKRVHVIHQPNIGLSGARNAGIDWVFANSSCKWIMFVDSDDVIHPMMLKRLYSVIQEYDADISVCGLQTFVKTTELQDNILMKKVKVRNGVKACYRLYDDDGAKLTVAVAKLYRRELLEDIRYPIGKLHEDEATTYKLLYRAKYVAELDEIYYGYRINPNSIMNSGFSIKKFDALEAFRDRSVFFKNAGEYDLTSYTERAYRTVHAKLIVYAYAAEKQHEIPKEYEMSLNDALKCLKVNLDDRRYTYYLAMVHPNWIRPHEYIRKIKKLLHIP